MNVAYAGDTMVVRAPLFFKFATAPDVGDTRVLSVVFFAFLFLGAVGVLQIIASYNRMRALSFFSRPILGYIFGLCAIVGGILLFYLTGDRNVLAPRLEGAQVLGGAFLGMLAALVVTLAIAHWLKRKQVDGTVKEEYPEGMEALKEEVYAPLMKRLWRWLKKRDR